MENLELRVQKMIRIGWALVVTTVLGTIANIMLWFPWHKPLYLVSAAIFVFGFIFAVRALRTNYRTRKLLDQR